MRWCGGWKAQLTTLIASRSGEQALVGGGRSRGVGRARGLLSLHNGLGAVTLKSLTFVVKQSGLRSH